MPDSRPSRPPAGAPNIVVIVIDDLGFADFGCYGSEVQTPNVDRLAAGGIRYNNFHVTAICTPTRACLMTGRNHHRVGMGYFPDIDMGLPGYSGRIPASAGTLPRILRDSGYNTFAAGKWHLVPRSERSAAGPFGHWPLGMGFERYYGFLGGCTNQWSPDLVRDNTFVDSGALDSNDYHLTEDLASQAVRFIQDQHQAEPDKPFFLYFAPGAMHSPLQVPRQWIDEYRSQFDDGWDAVRERAFARQLDSGLVPAETSCSERPPWVPAWDSLSAVERQVFARQMEVYAGFLSHTDAQIGRIIDYLEQVDALDNTLIMVLSDNGASAEGGPQGQLAGASDIAAMLERLEDFGAASNHYAWGWACTGNTPFPMWKRYCWLGGVRVPLIVHWPSGIPDDGRDMVRGQFCHAIDVMPTLVAAAGAQLPDTVDGVPQLTVDGVSFLPSFADPDSPSARDTQYFETLGSRAIYHDGWKATTNHIDATVASERDLIPGSHDLDGDRWALFDLRADFAETVDLAEKHPDRLEQLVELWRIEAERNHVLPQTDGIVADRAPGPDVAAHPDRYEYTCTAGGGPVFTQSSFQQGFDLLVDIEVADGQPVSGVICAHHNHIFGTTVGGGWSCYVVDGVLTIALPGLDGDLPIDGLRLAGRHRLEISYRPAASERGTLTVAIDGTETLSQPIAATAPRMARFLDGGKLSVGRDIDGYGLSSAYRPPFPFTGRIHRSVYKLARPPESDAAHQVVEASLQYE